MRQNRRGPRLNSRVPVAIEWNGSPARRIWNHFTRVVNNYGCLLVSPKEVELQQRLRLTNLSTRQAAEAVVVWKGTQRPTAGIWAWSWFHQNWIFGGWNFESR